MYPESDLLPLSALQHILFCPRQCALIHVERLWNENRWTAEGQVLHQKAHEGAPETRDGQRITRGLPLRSFELGVSGIADIVLWKPPPTFRLAKRTLRESILAASRDELAKFSIIPVEYKRGRPKKNDCDRVQVCAQGMCLEEMLQVPVNAGQIFYGTHRRRVDVVFDDRLRDLTRDAATKFHEMMASGVTPSATYEKKCDSCSLFELCLPTVIAPQQASRYLASRIAETSSS